MNTITPFERTSLSVGKDDWVTYCVASGQLAHAAEVSWAKNSSCEFYQNDTYLVQLDKNPPHQFKNAEVWLLWVSRLDRDFVRDRKDLLAIKNTLVGYDVEAVELFPAESRLSDATNRTALFCFMNLNGKSKPRFPVGPESGSIGYLGQH